MSGEGAVELARQVIAGPDRVAVHAHRRRAARGAHAGAPEAAAQRVVPQLPRTDPAHHRKHQAAAGAQQARAFGRDGGEIRRAVQRAEVGVDAVELAVEPIELLHAEVRDRHARLHGRGRRPRPRALDHQRRPVGGDDAKTAPGELERVDAGTAAQVEQAGAGLQLAVHHIPQRRAHALDQFVVAAWSVVVGGDTVERALRVEQLRLVQRCAPRRTWGAVGGHGMAPGFLLVQSTHIERTPSRRDAGCPSARRLRLQPGLPATRHGPDRECMRATFWLNAPAGVHAMRRRPAFATAAQAPRNRPSSRPIPQVSSGFGNACLSGT